MAAARICRFCRFEFSKGSSTRPVEQAEGAAAVLGIDVAREAVFERFENVLDFSHADKDCARAVADTVLHEREMRRRGLVPLVSDLHRIDGGWEIFVTFGPREALDERRRAGLTEERPDWAGMTDENELGPRC